MASKSKHLFSNPDVLGRELLRGINVYQLLTGLGEQNIMFLLVRMIAL